MAITNGMKTWSISVVLSDHLASTGPPVGRRRRRRWRPAHLRGPGAEGGREPGMPRAVWSEVGVVEWSAGSASGTTRRAAEGSVFWIELKSSETSGSVVSLGLVIEV